jgi:putative aldouronate transport system permease protein
VGYKSETALRTVKKRQISVWRQMYRSRQLYLLLLLPVTYLIIFKYVPMYGIQIAFRKYSPIKGILGSEWVGFHYFIQFFQSSEFSRIFLNTVELSLYQLFVTFPIPIILALSLNYIRATYFKKTVQMITYAPHFISVVVLIGIIMQFLNPRIGPVNNILGFFGIEPVHFMAQVNWFQSLFVWSDVWQNTGFSCIIYLAALSSVDPSLHEAAVVDGASKLRRVWHVDLPSIVPIAVILLILNMGNVLEIGYEKVLLMQNPLNLSKSEVIDTYVYKVGLASQSVNFSYGAAIGMFKNILSLFLLLVVNRIARKANQISLW